MKRITIKIDKEGAVEIVDALGYGSNCRTATEGLENRLGIVDEASRANTDNMYADPEGQSNTAGMG